MIVILRVPPSRAARWLAGARDFIRQERSKGISYYSFTRSIGLAAVGFAVCASTVADIPVAAHPGYPVLAPVLRTRTDPRSARLARFFQAYNCPQPLHVEEYLSAADHYGLDYRLLPAISIRETTCGLTQWQNNRWGYHPGRQTFPSVAVGIDYVARQLAENPFYMGKTLTDKLFTYNPLPAYPREVQQIMRQIDEPVSIRLVPDAGRAFQE